MNHAPGTLFLSLELQICLAVLLDLFFGDPRKVPHPVQIIGAAALRFEKIFRRRFRHEKRAGAFTWFLTICLTGAVVLFMLWGSLLLHPAAFAAVSAVILYTTVAARGLSRHCMDVYRALSRGDLAEARKKLSLIVSRDTSELDEAAVIRSTVESLAENLSDGVIAPIFYAVLGGPAAAMIYKAMSTMDSMFGYTTPEYIEFGYVSAKADDAANYLPARLTVLILAAAAVFTGEDGRRALTVVRKDAKKHASPNSGFPEAAMAGSLGLRFGGTYSYFGKSETKPVIGEDLRPVDVSLILRARRMLWVSLVLFLAVSLGARFGLGLLYGRFFLPQGLTEADLPG